MMVACIGQQRYDLALAECLDLLDRLRILGGNVPHRGGDVSKPALPWDNARDAGCLREHGCVGRS